MNNKIDLNPPLTGEVIGFMNGIHDIHFILDFDLHSALYFNLFSSSLEIHRLRDNINEIIDEQGNYK